MSAVSVRRLDPADAPAVATLLDRDPVGNVYLRSELLLTALRTGIWWASINRHNQLQGTLLGGSLVVPWIPHLGDAPFLATTLERQAPPRVMVGYRDQVRALHQSQLPPALVRETRDPQPLMALRRGQLRYGGGTAVRLGRIDDLDQLTLSAAAMHHEEMGVDPLTIDPAGWRTRMRTLVERQWSWVWMEGDEVVFKAELSAFTPEAVQIQGVYTAPPYRGRGIGRAGLAAVCAEIFRTVPVCSLYVNEYNTPALALYRRLGFDMVGEYATLMFS